DQWCRRSSPPGYPDFRSRWVLGTHVWLPLDAKFAFPFRCIGTWGDSPRIKLPGLLGGTCLPMAVQMVHTMTKRSNISCWSPVQIATEELPRIALPLQTDQIM